MFVMLLKMLQNVVIKHINMREIGKKVGIKHSTTLFLKYNANHVYFK